MSAQEVEFMTDWEKSYEGRLSMPFMPSDGYVSHQNPPDFTWGEVVDAEGYDLEISLDKNFEKIEYSAYNLEYNFFNFPNAFSED